MSSSVGKPGTDDIVKPRLNFLVFTSPPHISYQARLPSQQLSGTLDPTLDLNLQHKPLSPAQHMFAAPYPISDLRPTGIIDQCGVLFGLCLESPAGKVTNSIVDSSGFPGNILFQGSYRSINQAAEIASSMGYPGTLCWMTNPASSLDLMAAKLPPEYRKVDLQVRYIDSEFRKDTLLEQPEEIQEEWMMIVFPHDRQAVFRHGRPVSNTAKQPPLVFEEVVRDSLLGTIHRVGQFW
ncbi:hypothetical protein ACHAP5_011880 [Fusarium lateritium]